MTIIIQIILIVAVLGNVLLFLRGNNSRTRALTKIGAFLFVLFAISAIIFPSWTTHAANLIGVGRGTDLLLYCLVIVVVFMAVNGSIHRRREELRFSRLVRQVTLLEAPQPSSADLESSTQPPSTTDTAVDSIEQ